MIPINHLPIIHQSSLPIIPLFDILSNPNPNPIAKELQAVETFRKKAWKNRIQSLYDINTLVY